MALQKKAPPKMYQLKVTLMYSDPPIWRRVQVPSDIHLHKLHDVLQIAMGWTDSHLHQFSFKGILYGDRSQGIDFDMKDERRVRLNQIIKRSGQELEYEYDFGDGWVHEILVERTLNPEPNVLYPRCIEGELQCPPENIGGVWGYYRFLEAMGDEEHPEHEEFLDWAEGDYDPEAFDIEEVNEMLARLR